MRTPQLKTPILVLAFIRPELTEKLFESIRRVRPLKLFVAIDGPRNENDKPLVDEVKKIFTKIDWPCQLKTFYKETNKGLKGGYIDTLDWFFSHVEDGIILEDDCIPNNSFYWFCQELLEKYKHDDRIMQIAGSNCQRGWKRDNYSYYFSKSPYTWGWATWRRAWKTYSADMKGYKEFKDKGYLKDVYPNFLERMVLKSNFKHIINGFQVWDPQWVYNIIYNNGLVIIPNENLITNIGMSSNASNMTYLDKKRSLPTKELSFPLKHPPFMVADRESDDRLFAWSFKQKIINTFLRKTKLMHFFRFKN
ncbi:nucleotide-diphospho-sugar transferase [Candidatus Pacearchaeota archaeon]|nr:nucleotide-diphospho-sugar transferase [Candidatus Pacearchaeota archaeon]